MNIHICMLKRFFSFLGGSYQKKGLKKYMVNVCLMFKKLPNGSLK